MDANEFGRGGRRRGECIEGGVAWWTKYHTAACGEMGILNTLPPEPSPNSILQEKKKHSHSHSRNIGKKGGGGGGREGGREGERNRHSNEMRLFLHGL